MFLINWLPYICSSVYQMITKDENKMSPLNSIEEWTARIEY